MTVAGYIRKNIVLFGALVANIGIAMAKFVAAGITGSSSMLSEGFHSMVDSLNQLLMLFGQHRAQRPPDNRHPFGYGRELYFWSFVVAILIFGAGAGLSFYEGYVHLKNPEELRDPTINFIVLGVGMLFEGASWTIALREFAATKGKHGWWEALRQSKDPAVFVVLFEDSAALCGLIVAAIGVWASHWFEEPRLDGVASIMIGGILAIVAALLAREAKGLLIGEPADPLMVNKIARMVGSRDWVTCVNHVRTVHASPDKIFVAISADLDDAMTMSEGESAIEDLERELKNEFPQLYSIYLRPEKSSNAEPGFGA